MVRELLGIAYARELDSHLLDLSEKFDDWKTKKMSCGDLNECIHKFHDGISRDLWNTYNARSIHQLYLVGRAYSLKLLKKEEIPEELLDAVEKISGDFF